MANNEWYDNGGWYDTPKSAVNVGEARKKRGRDWNFPRIGGIVAIIVVLLVATSLIFAKPGSGEPRIALPTVTQELPEELPEDWQDFFTGYYDAVQSDAADIRIPRAELPQDYKLSLAKAEGGELSLQELYAKCSPSIVAISGYRDGAAGYSWGTGVVISADGLILTNAHVIDNCDSASVTLPDDSVLEARLVGADSVSDIAVLKIEADGLPAAEFGESGDLAVGERVAAIGNPLGETFRATLTDGIISAIERGLSYNGHNMTLLQTNTALNEGNSGGALFNMHGQVVGVTNMKMMSSYSSIEGIGFAIPSDTVSSVVNALVKDGVVRGRPSIGITVGGIPENVSSHYSLPEGLYVTAVVTGSDAAQKGVKAGDVLTHVNGEPVTTTEQVNTIKNEFSAGDTLTFTLWRDGESFEADVVLMDTNDLYGKG